MQEKSNVPLSEVLYILKEKKGVSLSQIEAKTGLSKSYLSRLISGLRDNPSLQVLLQLANFFNVDVSELLKRELIVTHIDKEEQEDKEKIEINVSFKKEFDSIYRELWSEIQNFCDKEKVIREDEINILNIIYKLKNLNKKL